MPAAPPPTTITSRSTDGGIAGIITIVLDGPARWSEPGQKEGQSMSEESRRRGLEMVEEVYQGRVTIDPTLTPHQAATVDHVFGEIWSRPGLDIRDRRLVVIGVLGMLGKSEILEIQFGAALDRGELNAEQIHEIL